MSSAQVTIRNAVHDLLVAIGGAPATGAKVIPSGDKGPRPVKPYFTIRVTAASTGTGGSAERLDGLSGSTPTARMVNRHEATVSVQGFGSGALDVLDTFVANLDSPASLAAQETSKIAALLMSGPTDISEIIDTAEEPRVLVELRVRYFWKSDVANQVAVAAIVLDADGERYDSDPDPLSIDYVYP